jgi:hypothetical protein
MSNGEGKPVEVWLQEEQEFGVGGSSKKGTLFNVEGGSQGSIEVGETERTDRPTQQGSAAAVTLILRLNGEEFPAGTIVAKGALPYEGGDIRSGHLAITGGTGGHAGLQGVVRVDSTNPKKYSVEGGG